MRVLTSHIVHCLGSVHCPRRETVLRDKFQGAWRKLGVDVILIILIECLVLHMYIYLQSGSEL
jgi:hypothetical protein